MTLHGIVTSSVGDVRVVKIWADGCREKTARPDSEVEGAEIGIHTLGGPREPR